MQEIPAGFFNPLAYTTHLSINLRGNNLMSLSPAAFYSNVTSWEQIGTKLVSGESLLALISSTSLQADIPLYLTLPIPLGLMVCTRN